MILKNRNKGKLFDYKVFFIFSFTLYALFFLLLNSCIKPFEPNFKSASINKYVVQGTLSSKEGWHSIFVSTSSGVENAAYQPLSRCQVSIVDDLGNEFTAVGDAGEYMLWMSKDDLVIGRGYKVKVITPNGEHLESEYDYLPDGPEILEPTYKIEAHPIQDIGDFLDGLQFYIDLKANKDQSRFYRWQLIETWEYHSRYPVEYYYDGEVQQVSPPDSSEFYCWVTDQVDEIFTLNTTNLSSNEIVGFPLHFVANNSSRLGVLYSLLVQQIAMSEDAYNYWELLRQNNTEIGGLYSSQPLAVKGNFKNLSNPDKEVLGFFQASTIHSVRIFVEPPPIIMTFTDKCNPSKLEHGFIEIKPYEYPAYLQTVEGTYSNILLNDECVLCTTRGGTTEKPAFWP